MKINEGILKIKRGVNASCSGISETNDNSKLLDCIKCENSVSRIILPDERQVGDQDYYKKGINEEKYLIEFLDKVPSRRELETYLFEEDNNYRITKLSTEKVSDKGDIGCIKDNKCKVLRKVKK
mgnify:FL=1